MILAVGELLIDLITTDMVADLSESNHLQVRAGGSAANLASFCAKNHIPVTFVASVGSDGFGETAIRHMEESGVASQYISRISHIPTTIIVVGKSHGTPEFIPYRGADTHIPVVDSLLIDACTIFHTTSFALSTGDAQTNILSAMQQASKAGKSVSVDWNYAEKIWGGNNNSKAVFQEIMKYRPLLKVSGDDMSRFLGDHHSLEDIKTYLAQLPCTVVCLTCGAEGVWYKTSTANWEHRSSLPTRVIDVTGAGDAFWSGFMGAYIQNAAISEAIHQGLLTARERLEQRL